MEQMVSCGGSLILNEATFFISTCTLKSVFSVAVSPVKILYKQNNPKPEIQNPSRNNFKS
jgi:hypothetical protein